MDPYAVPTTTTFNTITAASAVAVSGDTISIRPHTNWNQFPLPVISGYSETHAGGTETFPIKIDAGVSLVASGDPGPVSIWSSVPNPPSALILLMGVDSGTAPLTIVEDLILIGSKRGIQIADRDPDSGSQYVGFLGRISRCHFGWNQIGVDLINQSTMQASLTLRECRIRTNFGNPQAGSTAPPVLQPPSVGMRFHALSQLSQVAPPEVNVEIRNLLTLGNFSSMAPGGVETEGKSDFPFGPEDFTRLIEVTTKGSSFNLEHSTGSGVTPIPEVNMSIIGGNLDGMADPTDPFAGWDVGLFATTDQFNDGEHKDFSSGYRIETSGTEFDRFKVSGIHCVGDRWGRGVLTLNGNTIVQRTGHQASISTDDHHHNGVHVTSFEAYAALHVTGASILNNLGNGILLKTKSSVFNGEHAAPSGSFIDIGSASIHENGDHGLMHLVANDGIVGGAWHYINGVRSLLEIPGQNYSVEYGQGSVANANISNNGKAGLYFETNAVGNKGYVNCRYVNCIIWNNPQGGYLADLTGNDGKPYFLAPMGHCTLAGNGGDIDHPYSLEILEENRAGGIRPTYYWSEIAGDLSTKFYNSILERKSDLDEDFEPDMITGPNAFVFDDSSSLGIYFIGAAGLRYRDGGFFQLFGVSTEDQTPFVNSSSWTTLDPTNFYLANHGSSGDFGVTPQVFPLIGSESATDHAGNSRPDPATGLRDKGAHEYQ